MIHNQKIDLAIKFATIAHKNQFRKDNKELPYIYHPVCVGFILKDAGFSDDVIISGILHDVIEDSGVSKDEIVDLFGENVASIVASVSEDKNRSWEERKEDYMKKVLSSNIDVMAVASADNLHNMYNIIGLLNQGKDLKNFFKKDTNTTIKKYIGFVDSISDVWDHPIVVDLKSKSEELKKYYEK